MEGERCCDIALAISATAVVRPAMGVTRFSRPENAGMAGGSSSDLKQCIVHAYELLKKRRGTYHACVSNEIMLYVCDAEW